MANSEQIEKIRSGQGFIAALDQSGGSTPKVLGLYGVGQDQYANDDEMFDLMHGFRSRIVQSDAFNGKRVLGAILFEMTMEREISGTPSAQFLWENKGVVPFLKIDQGLAAGSGKMQLMNAMPGLDDLLERGSAKGIFGTKERSVIHAADRAGISEVVAQQFEVGAQVLSHDMVPILEPEVTISISDKAEAEDILLDEIHARLDSVPDGKQIMFKLSLPENANQYKSVAEHPKVMRLVALSGGYSQEEANARLAQNTGMIASFSRALAEGLNAQQSDADFNSMLDATIGSIFDASNAG